MQEALASRLMTARKAGSQTRELVKPDKVFIDFVTNDNLASRRCQSIYNPRTRDHTNLMTDVPFHDSHTFTKKISFLTISQLDRGVRRERSW